jgi:hypothetical protein
VLLSVLCYVTTDGQPASLSWSKAPIWGLRPDLYYLCDSYGLVLVGRPLWQEVGSVFCMYCWPLPAQSSSGPNPLALETIFYCLTFETSLFVASYDSQGDGGSIRPRLHKGKVLLACGCGFYSVIWGHVVCVGGVVMYVGTLWLLRRKWGCVSVRVSFNCTASFVRLYISNRSRVFMSSFLSM